MPQQHMMQQQRMGGMPQQHTMPHPGMMNQMGMPQQHMMGGGMNMMGVSQRVV